MNEALTAYRLSPPGRNTDASLAPPLSYGRGAVVFVAVMLASGYALATLDFDSSLNQLIEKRAEVDQSIDLTAELQKKGNPYSALSYLAMGSVGVLALLLAPRPRVELRPVPLLLVAGYAVLAIGSMLWSEDLGLTLRRSLALALMLLSAFGVSRMISLTQLAWVLAAICVAYVAAGVYAELYHGLFIPWSSGYRFGGVQHPNGQAMLAALAAIGCFVFLPGVQRHRWLVYGLLLFSVIVVVMTKSRTSAGAALAAVLFALVLRSGVRGALVWGAYGAVLLGLVLTVVGVQGQRGVGAASSAVTMGRGEHVGSLTGRIPLWTQLLSLSSGHTVQGAGYGAFWNAKTTERISYTQGWNISHSHSIYLQTYLELGLIGLLLLVALLLCLLVLATQDYLRTRSPERLYAASVTVLAIIHGLAETSFASRGLPFFTLTAIAGYLSWTAPAGGPVRRLRLQTAARRGGPATAIDAGGAT